MSRGAETTHPGGGYAKVALAALFWSYLRNAIATLVAIPTAVILARLLSPADFGIAAAAQFFARVVARASNFGMGAALIRMPSLRDDHLSSVFTFSFGIGLSAFGMLWLAAPAIGRFFDNAEVGSAIPVIAVSFVLGSFFAVPQALLSRDLRYRELSTSGTIDLLVSSLSACLLAWAGFGFWSLVLCDPLGVAARGVTSACFAHWRPTLGFSRQALRDLFSFGAGSHVSGILNQLALNVDNVVIGRVLGVTALGFYDKGFSVGQKLFTKLSIVGPNVMFRIFSIIQEDAERFRRAYRKVILSSTLLTYPAYTVLIATAYPLFLVAFGEKWLPSVVPFQIICVSLMIRLTNAYANAAAQSRGWIWSQVWRDALGVVLIGVSVYVLSPWGINGAATAVLAVSMIAWLLMQHLLRKATPLTWRDMFIPQVPAIVCSLLLSMVLELSRRLLASVWPGVDSVMLLVWQSALALVVYLAFLRLSGFDEVEALLNETLSNVSPRVKRLIRLPTQLPVD